MNKICVVGLGYIGLPVASLLAAKGNSVLGVDVQPHVVQTINRGEIHIVEPELDVLVRSAVQSGNFRAAESPAAADTFVICVPTPVRAGHQPDLAYVEAAFRSVVPHLRPGNLIILESTCPVGTTEELAVPILREAGFVAGDSVHLAYCPERVLPGRILQELVENHRVVGGITPESTERAAAFYEAFVQGRVVRTNARTAEMVKLTENSFRDVNIAFANELSVICHKSGIDPWELIRLANLHPRVNILQPGPGVGGHCIAVDPWFIVASSPEEARLIRTAREVNDDKPRWVVDRVAEHAAKFKNPRIACLGLAYKPDVDDLRESPAVEVLHMLTQRRLGELLVSEPFVHGHAEFNLVPWKDAVAQADIVVILVDHTAFRELRAMDLSGKTVVDTRGLLNPAS